MIRLMLVDDHALLRDALALLLRREPDLEIVVEAGSLAEAREALGEKFDVAVVDLGLPDGEERELIGELRLAKLGVSVLVLSATLEPERFEEVKRSGADAVLDKVVAVSSISDEVRRVAGR
jgi:DNA-binding NarL/FixJ family response regulator